MKPILAFDVDGVLVDSEHEIILTSWNEHNLWRKSKGLDAQPFTLKFSEIPAEYINLYKRFRKHSNKNYYRIAINLLMFGGIDPDKITSDVVKQISEANESEITEIKKRIKDIRKRLHSEADLNEVFHPYAAVDYQWIEQLHAKGQVYFITNNPGSLTGFKHIAFQPDEKHIRTDEAGISDKSIHLNEIIEKEGINPASILFIDDSLQSLQEVHKGTDIPISNIIHNTWAPASKKLPADSGFPDLDFDAIKKHFLSLGE